MNSTPHGRTNPGESTTAVTRKVDNIYISRSDIGAHVYCSEIRRYLRQYRKREAGKKSTATIPQRGQPSWAQSSSSQMDSIPSALKRKVSAGGYDGRFKRAKDSVLDLDSD